MTGPDRRALLAERNNFKWLLLQDWAGEFFDEMRGLWQLLRAANGHGGARRVHRLPHPCPACGVRAFTHRPGDDLVSCQNCGPADAVDREKISA